MPLDQDKYVSNWFELGRALIWPIFAVFVTLTFRKEVRKLIDRIKKFKHGETEVAFSEGVERTQDLASKLDATPGDTGGGKIGEEGKPEASEHKQPEAVAEAEAAIAPTERGFNGEWMTLLHLAEESSSAAVLGAWAALEREIMSFGGVRLVPWSSGTATAYHRAIAGAIDSFPATLKVMINELRRLRNAVAHDPDISVSSADAKRFVESTYRAFEAVRAMKRPSR